MVCSSMEAMLNRVIVRLTNLKYRCLLTWTVCLLCTFNLMTCIYSRVKSSWVLLICNLSAIISYNYKSDCTWLCIILCEQLDKKPTKLYIATGMGRIEHVSPGRMLLLTQDCTPSHCGSTSQVMLSFHEYNNRQFLKSHTTHIYTLCELPHTHTLHGSACRATHPLVTIAAGRLYKLYRREHGAADTYIYSGHVSPGWMYCLHRIAPSHTVGQQARSCCHSMNITTGNS